MLRSIQEIAFSMKLQADNMNVIANNIANVNTRAYKRERLSAMSFGEALIQAMQFNDGRSAKTPVGDMVLGVDGGKHRTVFEQGSLEQTNINTDLGIRGNGFFTVETPNGIQYTRAGNFRIDGNGYLVTQEGYYVLSTQGRIYLPEKNFQVDQRGNVMCRGYTYALNIADFNDLNQLQRAGDGYFVNPVPQNLKAAGKTDILQGWLECSNVNIVEETRDMLAARRNYESGQQIIRMIDDTLGKAVNEIGKL